MNEMSASASRARGGRGRARVLDVGAVIVAAGLQLLVGWFTITAVGLIGVPLWAVVALGLAWVAAAGLLWLLARSRPLAAPLVPLANGLVLWASVTAGERWLGWLA